MIRGIYTSASGMVVQQNNQDTIANNLANINTTAFQKDRTAIRQFPEMLMRRLEDYSPTGPGRSESAPFIGRLGTGATTDKIWTDYTRMGSRVTGNATDVALTGRGYFVVLASGEERYTRNGQFIVAPDGRLMSQSGEPVQGQGGDIVLPPRSKVTIDDQGRVLANGQEVDQLRIVDFPDPTPGQDAILVKQGDSLFAIAPDTNTTPQTLTGTDGIVKAGALENSNVNVVQEMVQMIAAARAYEANQKAITAQDGTLEKTVNEVGRA